MTKIYYNHQQDSKTARQQDSKTARQQDSKTARQQDSKTARQQDSKTARQANCVSKFANKYLRNLKPYKTASHKIWTVNDNQRSEILKLDWNEAAIPPAPEVQKAILNLANKPDIFNLYPATHNHELLQALSNYAGVPDKNIQYFGSSDALHEYIAKVYIAVGDPVLILWPSYDNFRLTAEAHGAKIFYSDMGDKFIFNPDNFISDIENFHPSLVYICNPNNPTGILIEPEIIEKFLNIFSDTLFIIDEAYGEFAEVSVNSLTSKYNNILVTHTMSKAFALANFRFGYLVASPENINEISKIRNPKNITSFAQTACLAALSNIEYMRNYVNEVKSAREFFINFIKSECKDNLTAYHSHGNFVLIKCAAHELKDKILAELEAHNIFIRNVSQSPSLADCVRVTIGTCEHMRRVAAAIQEILEN